MCARQSLDAKALSTLHGLEQCYRMRFCITLLLSPAFAQATNGIHNLCFRAINIAINLEGGVSGRACFAQVAGLEQGEWGRAP